MFYIKKTLFILVIILTFSCSAHSCPDLINCNQKMPTEILLSFNTTQMSESEEMAMNGYALAAAPTEEPTEEPAEAPAPSATGSAEATPPAPSTDTPQQAQNKTTPNDAPEINTESQEIEQKSSRKKEEKKVETVEAGAEVLKQEDDNSENNQKKKPESKIKITGFRYLKHKYFEASGDKSSYMSRAGVANKTGKIEQGTQLNVKAEFGKKSGLEGSFSEMPLQDRKMTIRLTQGALGMTYGSFSAKFPGGDLSPFSKSVDGIQADYETKKQRAIFITSKSKSQTKTVNFTGRNIKGPYDLNARDLLIDGMIVRLNNEVLTPDQYLFEPYLGQITFYEILGPDDRVAVTFDQNLTGNLNEGNLSGMAYEYVAKKGALKFGVSILQKDAVSASQAAVGVQNEEVYKDNVFSSIQIKSANSKQYFLVVRKDLSRGSESITKNGVKLVSAVDYNVATTEVTKSDLIEGYAHGKFYLSSPIAENDVFRVSYSYYRDDVISCYTSTTAPELVISSSIPNEAYLGADPKTLYYGSEKIYGCVTEDLSTCNVISPLERETDYIIDETANVVRFLTPANPSAAYKLYRFEGCTYPNVSVVSSAYAHKVIDYRVKYAPGGKYELSYETAQSEADISTKPLSILNETIRLSQPAPLDCTGANARDAACSLQMSHKNIVPGSLILYFNDRINDDSVVTPFNNFETDTLNGKINLTMIVPAGTPIIVDYQYNPAFRPGPETGTKSKLKGSYKSSLTNISFELNSGDTYFTPVGGESNLETSRTSIQISRKLTDRLDVGVNLLNVTNALDIDENNELKGKQSSYAFTYKPRYLKSLKYVVDMSDRSDDYNPRRTDTSEKRSTLSTGMNVPFLKNASVTLSVANSDVTDNTTADNKRTTDNKTMGFSYAPSKRLSFDTKLTTNEISVKTADNAFVSTNQSRSLTGKWQPFTLISVMANFDTQLKSDSRNAAGDSEVNKSRFSITSAPFGKVKNLSYSFTQEDRPSISGVSSGSKNSNISFGYQISNSISSSPSLSVTRTDSGNNSKTKTISRSNLIEFLPPGKPYRANLNYQNTQSSSVRQSGGENKTNETWSSTISYIPSTVWTYSLKLEKDAQTSGSGSTGGYDTFTLNTKVNRNPSPTLKQWFLYQRINRSGSISQVDSVFEIGNDKKLTDIVTFNLLFRYNSFTNTYNSASNYSGYLVESTFRATF